MVERNIPSRLLMKVARGLQIAGGGGPIGGRPSEGFSEGYPREENHYEIITPAGLSPSAAPDALSEEHSAKEAPLFAADNEGRASVAAGNPRCVLEEMGKDEGMQKDPPSPEEVTVDAGLEYAEPANGFLTAETTRGSTFPEQVSGPMQRQGRHESRERGTQRGDIQEGDVPSETGTTESAAARTYSEDSRRTEEGRQKLGEAGKPALKERGMTQSILDVSPQIRQRAAPEPSAVQGETKKGNQHAHKRDAMLKTGKVRASAKMTPPDNEPMDHLFTQEKVGDRAEISRDIRSQDQGDGRELKTIGHFVSAVIVKAKPIAKGEAPGLRAEADCVQSGSKKGGNIHIGAINVSVKGREKSAEESWPEAPHYTNHVITEDWDWSCRYGR